MAKKSTPLDDVELDSKVRALCESVIADKIDSVKKRIYWTIAGFSAAALVLFPAAYMTRTEFVKRSHNELWGSASISDVKGLLNSGKIASTYQAKIILKKSHGDNDRYSRDFIIFQAAPSQQVKLYFRTFHTNESDKRKFEIYVNNKKHMPADHDMESGLWAIDISNNLPDTGLQREESRDINTLGFDLVDTETNYESSTDEITITCIVFVYANLE